MYTQNRGLYASHNRWKKTEKKRPHKAQSNNRRTFVSVCGDSLSGRLAFCVTNERGLETENMSYAKLKQTALKYHHHQHQQQSLGLFYRWENKPFPFF